MTTLVLAALVLLRPQAPANTTISRDTVVEVWISSRPPDKKTGGLLIAGGVAGMVLGAIAKSPEAGPSGGFYVGVPLVAAGAYVQHHNRQGTLVYAQLSQDASIARRAWRDVQSLRPGMPIRVVMKAGDVEGTFVAANDDVLVIHLKNGNFSVDRTGIRRLDKKLQESNRGRNIDRGAAIGFVAGLLRSKFVYDCGAVGGSIITMQSMLLGTVVGATASAAKWETVYRREK